MLARYFALQRLINRPCPWSGVLKDARVPETTTGHIDSK